MAISRGHTSLTLKELLDSIPETRILAYYLGVTEVPTVINSPLRKDEHPSFGISSPDGKKIYFRDFATGDCGDLIDLLARLWGYSIPQIVDRIYKDLQKFKTNAVINRLSTEHKHSVTYNGNTTLDVKVRGWKEYDIEYWGKYGVPLDLLKRANVYPISHFMITKNGNRSTFIADKYAYAYVEFKEGNLTIKVYQPFNKNRFKWISKHDRSVLGLWTLMPESGNVVCICSSVKDALCLYANTGIPAICLQGEAYGISITAQNVLRSRFKNVCILLDNDAPGIADADKLSKETGFINIELPKFEGGKDISDFYAVLEDKTQFKPLITNLLKTKLL